MRRLGADGRRKVDHALDATRTFLHGLSLEGSEQRWGDRAALVGFHHEAWLASPLTADRRGLDAALDAMAERTEEFTRLDLGLAETRRAFTSTRDPGARSRVAVLLTDGLPNRVPAAEDGRVETTVLREAQALRNLGVTVFAVGFGKADDLDGTLLQAVAGEARRYRRAEDASTLSALFGALAVGVRCP